MTDWISVEDRLPEQDGQRVIFCVYEEIFKGRYYPMLPYPFENDDMQDNVGAYKIKEVKGWLTIPDPLQ